jgi:hypothetical protein
MLTDAMKPGRGGVVLLVLSLAVSGVARAQPTAMGVFAGASSSSMKLGSRTSTNTDRTGFTGGVGLRTRIPGFGPIAVNLLLSKKGFEVSEPTLHFTYLEIPVVYHIELAGNRARVQPYFGVGVAVAGLLSCRRSFVGVSGPYQDDCGRTQAQNLQLNGVRGWDFSQDYRLGARFRVGAGGLVLEARHARGMLGVGGDAGSGSKKDRHRILALTLGYEWWRQSP